MKHKTIAQMFNYVTNEFSNTKLYHYKKQNEWIGISGSAIRSTVKDLSFALKSLDVTKGSNVAILSNNSPRWAMSDYGIICSGAASVGIYPTLIASQVEYIINNSN